MKAENRENFLSSKVPRRPAADHTDPNMFYSNNNMNNMPWFRQLHIPQNHFLKHEFLIGGPWLTPVREALPGQLTFSE